jgi:hypothetical protein
VRTRHLSLVTSTHSVTTTVRSSALSPFGPVRAGLTTWQTTNDPVLTELLSSLEREVASLVSKSCTLCDMLSTATAEVSAAVSSIAIEGAGTDGKE